MEKRRSEFKHWFRRQYGRMPDGRKLQKAQDKVFVLRDALNQAESELEIEKRLSQAMNDALYGWNARSPRS